MDRSHRFIPSLQDWIIRASDRSMHICMTPARASYVPVTDDEAVEAFEYLSRTEGIIPAIESAHAVAHAKKIAGSYDQRIQYYRHATFQDAVIKTVAAIARYRGVDIT